MSEQLVAGMPNASYGAGYCGKCDQLQQQYDLQWSQYFSAMDNLLESRHTATAAECLRLEAEAERARTRSELARTRLETHLLTHSKARAVRVGHGSPIS